MPKFRSYLIFFICALILGGCGQTGPLYLPHPYKPHHSLHKQKES